MTWEKKMGISESVDAFFNEPDTNNMIINWFTVYASEEEINLDINDIEVVSVCTPKQE